MGNQRRRKRTERATPTVRCMKGTIKATKKSVVRQSGVVKDFAMG